MILNDDYYGNDGDVDCDDDDDDDCDNDDYIMYTCTFDGQINNKKKDIHVIATKTN